MAAISDTKTAPVAEVISSCPVSICVGGAEFSVTVPAGNRLAAKGGRHA
jgi:hypothetical protein